MEVLDRQTESNGDDSLSESKRLNVSFSGETYDLLTRLAKKRNKKLADVIRDALSLEEWLDEVQQNNETILVEKNNGRIREIEFLR